MGKSILVLSNRVTHLFSWETVPTAFTKKSCPQSFPAISIFQVSQVIKRKKYEVLLLVIIWFLSFFFFLLFPHISLEWIPQHQCWAEIFEETYRQELCSQFDMKAEWKIWRTITIFMISKVFIFCMTFLYFKCGITVYCLKGTQKPHQGRSF